MIPLLLLFSCGSADLSQSYELDRLRILGVQATPAEPQPGEVTTMTSLVYVPEGETLSGVIWFACLPDAASTSFGCEIDESAFDALSGFEDEKLSEEELAAMYKKLVAAGFVGFEPDIPPIWIPPVDALDGLDDIAKQEGLSAVINITAIPEGADEASNQDEVELAYKRIPVSLSPTPNQNPELTDWLVDGVAHTGVLLAQPGQTYALQPTVPDDAIESYSYINSDGESETRTEEPFLLWYLEGGTFDQSFSLYPYTEVEWTAPDTAFSGVIIAVMRDRRGGMDWLSLFVEVEG